MGVDVDGGISVDGARDGLNVHAPVALVGVEFEPIGTEDNVCLERRVEAGHRFDGARWELLHRVSECVVDEWQRVRCG